VILRQVGNKKLAVEPTRVSGVEVELLGRHPTGKVGLCLRLCWLRYLRHRCLGTEWGTASA
jgi:hypothetical protein